MIVIDASLQTVQSESWLVCKSSRSR